MENEKVAPMLLRAALMAAVSTGSVYGRLPHPRQRSWPCKGWVTGCTRVGLVAGGAARCAGAADRPESEGEYLSSRAGRLRLDVDSNPLSEGDIESCEEEDIPSDEDVDRLSTDSSDERHAESGTLVDVDGESAV